MNLSLMQKALGTEWQQLSPALQAHYQREANCDIGVLDIDYPGFMQIYLSVMHLMGALINRRGKRIPTTVRKWMEGDTQHWERTIRFPKGKVIQFKSHWVFSGNNEVIEYINPYMGLRMAMHVEKGRLYYKGKHIVLQLGPFRLPIPEWLLLGHTTIEEIALDKNRFTMDFRIRHPLFGQVYRYAGEFQTKPTEK